MNGFFSFLNRYRRPIIVVLAAWSLTSLAALLIPVDQPDGDLRGDRHGYLIGSAAKQSTAEDLDAFFDSRRWGVSLREINDLLVGANQPGLNPVLAEMGYVGLIMVSGQNVPATEYCTGSGDTCPWLWADASLLLLGVVPGVIALIVDFGSGAWQHTHQRKVRQARDGISSAHTLFPPTHRAG